MTEILKVESDQRTFTRKNLECKDLLTFWARNQQFHPVIVSQSQCIITLSCITIMPSQWSRGNKTTCQYIRHCRRTLSRIWIMDNAHNLRTLFTICGQAVRGSVGLCEWFPASLLSTCNVNTSGHDTTHAWPSCQGELLAKWKAFCELSTDFHKFSNVSVNFKRIRLDELLVSSPFYDKLSFHIFVSTNLEFDVRSLETRGIAPLLELTTDNPSTWNTMDVISI